MSKKGVMLSQNGGSEIGGSKATLGSGGPSIGNYKGVMLCNRPFRTRVVTKGYGRRELASKGWRDNLETSYKRGTR